MSRAFLGGKLTDGEPESLSAGCSGLFSGLTVSGHLGYLHTGRWFAGEALPRIRLAISSVLGAVS